jgi:hypothetical protein
MPHQAGRSLAIKPRLHSCSLKDALLQIVVEQGCLADSLQHSIVVQNLHS